MESASIYKLSDTRTHRGLRDACGSIRGNSGIIINLQIFETAVTRRPISYSKAYGRTQSSGPTLTFLCGCQ